MHSHHLRIMGGLVNYEWRYQAACAGLDTDTFYPSGEEDMPVLKAIAKAYCSSCPVQGECLAEAEELGDLRYALRGGQLPSKTWREAVLDEPLPPLQGAEQVLYKGLTLRNLSEAVRREYMAIWKALRATPHTAEWEGSMRRGALVRDSGRGWAISTDPSGRVVFVLADVPSGIVQRRFFRARDIWYTGDLPATLEQYPSRLGL